MFKKPNQKGITDAAIQIGAGVVGAKLGDALVAIVPDSAAKYKKIGIGVAAIVGAACITATTTGGKAAQAALAGVGVKQLYDVATEKATKSIQAKLVVDGKSSLVAKFQNGMVGHLGEPAYTPYQDWPSYEQNEPAPQPRIIGM